MHAAVVLDDTETQQHVEEQGETVGTSSARPCSIKLINKSDRLRLLSGWAQDMFLYADVPPCLIGTKIKSWGKSLRSTAHWAAHQRVDIGQRNKIFLLRDEFCKTLTEMVQAVDSLTLLSSCRRGR